MIITHVELFKGNFGFTSYWSNPFFFSLGSLAVYFFFVLSGFLITYLLLIEKEKFGKIEIRKFYFRRILRIWPLYYLILIIGFFVLPQFNLFKIGYLEDSFYQNFSFNLLLYLLILPNVAFSLFPSVPYIGQAWSIGVEEQFYIIWPLLLSKSKSIIKTMLIIIFVLVFFKILVLLLGKFSATTFWYEPLKLLVAMSKFECMAIGGIGAYLLYTNNSLLRIIYMPLVFLVSILVSILLIYFTPDRLQDGIHLVYSILFLQIILFVAKQQSSSLFENKLFNYLGKISYGIYMYHFMVIPFCLNIYLKHFAFNSIVLENLFIYGATILITLLMSAISYTFFESRFIKLKSQYARVKSG